MLRHANKACHRSKKGDTEAALKALTGFKSDAAANKIFAAFSGKDRDIAFGPAKDSKADALKKLLLVEAEKALAEVSLLKKNKEDKADIEKKLQYFLDIIICLKQKRDHNNIALFKSCIEATEQLAKLREPYIAKEAAILSCSPQEVFATYGQYAVGTRNNPACKRIFEVFDEYKKCKNSKKDKVNFDPAWIDILIKNRETELVAELITEGHTAGIEYLRKQLKNGKIDYINALDSYEIVKGLIKAKYIDGHKDVEEKLAYFINAKALLYVISYFMRTVALMGAGFSRVLEEMAVGCKEEVQAILLETAQKLSAGEKEQNG